MRPIFRGSHVPSDHLTAEVASMTCSFDLKRSVDAQSPVLDQVCSELRAGQKRSHWMWYIFPQISGLGSSRMVQTFAISSNSRQACVSP